LSVATGLALALPEATGGASLITDTFGVAAAPVYDNVIAVDFGVADPPAYDDPFGVAAAPDYTADVIEFGQALHHTLAIADLKAAGELDANVDEFATKMAEAREDKPEMTADGLPVIEWEPATREQLGDGDTVRVTQIGRWKGTRLVGKTVTYERRTAEAVAS